VNFLDADGRYEKKTSTIRVRNSGKIDLSNIRVRTKNDSQCDASWLKFKESDIPYLAKGETKTLLIEISAPVFALDSGTMSCKIRYWYDNPVTAGAQADGEMNDWIQITPRRA
ncbi:MAG: hypothetical protein PHH08_03650, partial [Candidatus ainarchaeum sp.]|nr:hypothetical protein [Candidatus ainarchaeum sp.]